MTLLSRRHRDQPVLPSIDPPDQHAGARALLLTAREEAARAIATLMSDLESVVLAGVDANTDDEHDPEGATLGFERAQVASLLDSERRNLVEIDSALERLGTPSYGICELCGTVITPERLLVRPAARQCVGCAATRRISR